MISVITCTMNPARLAKLRNAYFSVLGPFGWELIIIPDARSMAEGYNRAVAKSRGDVLLFSREHIAEFLKPDLAQRLAGHLTNFDLVGTLGTTVLAGADWQAAGYPHLYGQAADTQDGDGYRVRTFNAPRPSIGNMEALDGVLLAVKRSVFSRLTFDAATFDGFDLCEMDFTVSARAAGFRLGVACDLGVVHGLTYPPVEFRQRYVERFEKKWAIRLAPPVVRKERIFWIRHPNRQEAAAALEPPYWQNAAEEEALPTFSNSGLTPLTTGGSSQFSPSPGTPGEGQGGGLGENASASPLPMLSIVVCSRETARLDAMKSLYAELMADAPWEFIGIENPRSLAEAYTQAVAQSKGENILFSHDDIEILSPQLPQRIAHHLKTFDIIGLAGTHWLYHAGWHFGGPPFIVGQVSHPYVDDNNFSVNLYAVPRRVIGGVQAIDGVFMAARKSVFQTVGFDARNFDGFHLYDLDFSYSAYHAGLKMAVVTDIHIIHNSGGVYGETWQTFADRFRAKWSEKLPKTSRQLFFSYGDVIFANTREEIRDLMNAPPFLKDK